MNPPHIPATALDDTLIAGWSGPCEVLAHARFPVALPDAAHLAMLQGKSAWVSCFLSLDACAGESLPRRNVCLDRGQNFSFDPSRCRMRLDPRREEVATRIATVLRAKGHEVGHLLPVSLGGRQCDAQANAPIPASCSFHGNARHVEPLPACLRCGGSGRVPFESDDFPPGTNACCCTCSGCRSEKVTIPAADVSALTLAASVAGVEAEGGVVRGVLGERAPISYMPEVAGRTLTISHGLRSSDVAWWSDCGDWYAVDDDAALLRLGYAYLDPAAPFGVVVPTFDLEKR